MKTLFYINNGILGIIILSGLLGFVNYEFWGVTIIGTIGLGLYQSISGFILYITHPRNIEYLLYMVGVIGFFTGVYFFKVGIIWVLPFTLGVYFSFILYSNSTKKVTV